MAEKVVTIRISVDTGNASNALRDVGVELKNLQTNAAESGKNVGFLTEKFNAFNTGLGQLQSVFGQVAGGVQMIGDFAHLGQQVDAVTGAFTNLSGGTQSMALNLELLRAAVGGTVADIDLMQGANRMFSMGLAQTGESAARLTELAVKLGGAMGNDATASIENFSLMLANQSVRRLDSFGISVQAVRDKMEKFKEAGMDAQQAFTMATLEAGGIALDRLGTSVNALLTPLNKMEASAENIKNSIASWFSQGVNQGIANIGTMVDKVVAAKTYTDELNKNAGESPETTQARQVASQKALSIVNAQNVADPNLAGTVGALTDSQMQELYNAYLKSGGAKDQTKFINEIQHSIGGTVLADKSHINELADTAKRYADEFERAAIAQMKAQSAMDATAQAAARTSLQMKSHFLIEDKNAGLDQMRTDEAEKKVLRTGALKDLEYYNNQYKAMQFIKKEGDVGKFEGDTVFSPQAAKLAANEVQILSKSLEEMRSLNKQDIITDDEVKNAEKLYTDAVKINETIQSGASHWQDMQNAIETAAYKTKQLSGIGGLGDQSRKYSEKEGVKFAGVTLFDEAEIAKLDSYKAKSDELLASISVAHDEGLVSDADFENAKKAAEQVSRLADEAHRGAEAFANMNLNTLLGQTSGGVLGEIGDKIIAGFKGTDKQKSELEKTLDLASGRETEASVALDEKVVPLLAELGKRDPRAAVDAAKKIDEYIVLARQAGLTDQQIATGVVTMTDMMTVQGKAGGAISSAGGASTGKPPAFKNWKERQAWYAAQAAGTSSVSAAHEVSSFDPARLVSQQLQPVLPMDDTDEFDETMGGMAGKKRTKPKEAGLTSTKQAIEDMKDLKATQDGVKKGVDDIGHGFEHVSTQVKTIVKDIGSIVTSKTVEVNVKMLMSAADRQLATALIAATQNNGGVSPGTNPRVGKGPTAD